MQLTSQQRATRHKAKLASVERALQLKAEQVMSFGMDLHVPFRGAAEKTLSGTYQFMLCDC